MEWSIAKMKGFAVGATALWATSGTTSLIKEKSERTRPDGSDNFSFPSGHSSDTGSLTTLTRRNIACISIPPTYRRLSNIALYGISAGTAWARVEAKKHYPSDVLVGYALGHFISAVIHDSFMELEKNEGLLFSIEPSRRGINFGITWTY